MNQIEKIIDIATWNRKEHFEHFSAFDDPFFGIPLPHRGRQGSLL